MTTNTSAGLTRMNIGHYGDGLDVYDADEVEALLADLRGKLADANKRADTYVSIALDRATDLCKADSRIAQLEAELAAATKDAERYRWLRSGKTEVRGLAFIGIAGPGGISRFTDEHADSAIDAAIAATQANEEGK
jgi:hypothetical protein